MAQRYIKTILKQNIINIDIDNEELIIYINNNRYKIDYVILI